MLDEQHRQQLDQIVQQMTQNQEPDANVQAVVNDFKQKYSTQQVQPKQSEGFLAKYFPGSRLAQGVGQSLFNVLGGSQQLEEAATTEREAQGKLVDLFSRTKEGPQKEKLRSMIGEYKAPVAEGYSDVATGGLTNKQVLASAGELGLLATGARIPRVPINVGQGVGQFVKSVGINALATGSEFGAFSGLGAVSNKGSTEDVIKATKQGFLTGAIGSGLFNTALVAPFKALTSPKSTSWLFRTGLGFPRVAIKSEEKANKMASDYLIQYGGGTARQLKERYATLADDAERQIQSQLTASPVVFKTTDIIDDITKKLIKDYEGTYSQPQIRQVVDSLPLDALRTKQSITIGELNALRRKISNFFLKDSNWISAARNVEGKIHNYTTASNVMSELVKDAAPGTRSIFQKYSALIKGFDAALNSLSASKGPVNTAARLGAPAGAGLFGLLTAGPVGALAATGVEELARSTLGRTTAATLLRGAGGAAQKAGASTDIKLLQLLGKSGIGKSIGSQGQ